MPEAAYRKMRAINRQRRNDHIDARAVSETRIHHGRRFIHAPADGRYDFVDDVHEVRIVLEHDVAFLKNACALYIDLLGPVDKNVVDGWVLEEWLKRTKAEDLIQHFKGKPFTLASA